MIKLGTSSKIEGMIYEIRELYELTYNLYSELKDLKETLTTIFLQDETECPYCNTALP